MALEKPVKRRYRLSERRYIAEYIRQFYPDAPVWFNIRMGTLEVPPEATPEEIAEARMLYPLKRWCDAMIILPDRLILVEGKLLPARYPEGLTKLQLYLNLAPTTPEIIELMPRRIEGELLTPLEDPVIKMMAFERGIRNVIWKPPWFEEYLATLPPRMRRPERWT